MLILPKISRFNISHPFAICIFKHCWCGNCLCIPQLSANRLFGKSYTFGMRISQKLKNTHTEIQSSSVQAHKTFSPYQCDQTLVSGTEDEDNRCPLLPPLPWSLIGARALGKLHVLQILEGSLVSREYSMRMLPCSSWDLEKVVGQGWGKKASCSLQQ